MWNLSKWSKNEIDIDQRYDIILEYLYLLDVAEI